MLVSKKIIDLLQLRIKNEEANNKLYNQMSYYLNINGYSGASSLWKTYANDEKLHKDWAVQYLLDLNILPIEPSEEQPEIEFKGLPNIIALSYKREIQTTKEVTELLDICLEEGDYLTLGLAQKYVAEQVEEISKIQFWIDKLESFGGDKIALRLLDEEMGRYVK